MACPECDAAAVSFSVPAEYRDAVPESASVAGICTRCLTLFPRSDADPDEQPAFDRISTAFPTGPGAVETALIVGLLDALAPNRGPIEELVLAAEASGKDPLLVLERLQDDPELDPSVDLDRRTHQLRQLL